MGLASGPILAHALQALQPRECFVTVLDWRRTWSVSNLDLLSHPVDHQVLAFFLIHNSLQLCLSSCYLCFFSNLLVWYHSQMQQIYYHVYHQGMQGWFSNHFPFLSFSGSSLITPVFDLSQVDPCCAAIHTPT